MRNSEHIRLRLSTCAGLVLSTLLAAMGHGDAAPLHVRTATARINGSVATDCTLTASPISFTFGAAYVHSKNNQPIVRSTTLSVRCSKGAVVQIGMNTGLYGSKAGTQFGSRSMKSSPGNSYLGYELCHDSGCTSIWASAGYTYASPSVAGSTLPVWGQIKTGQQVDAGSYSDSVTVTVNF